MGPSGWRLACGALALVAALFAGSARASTPSVAVPGFGAPAELAIFGPEVARAVAARLAEAGVEVAAGGAVIAGRLEAIGSERVRLSAALGGRSVSVEGPLEEVDRLAGELAGRLVPLVPAAARHAPPARAVAVAQDPHGLHGRRPAGPAEIPPSATAPAPPAASEPQSAAAAPPLPQPTPTSSPSGRGPSIWSSSSSSAAPAPGSPPAAAAPPAIGTPAAAPPARGSEPAVILTRAPAPSAAREAPAREAPAPAASATAAPRPTEGSPAAPAAISSPPAPAVAPPAAARPEALPASPPPPPTTPAVAAPASAAPAPPTPAPSRPAPAAPEPTPEVGYQPVHPGPPTSVVLRPPATRAAAYQPLGRTLLHYVRTPQGCAGGEWATRAARHVLDRQVLVQTQLGGCGIVPQQAAAREAAQAGVSSVVMADVDQLQFEPVGGRIRPVGRLRVVVLRGGTPVLVQTLELATQPLASADPERAAYDITAAGFAQLAPALQAALHD